MTRSPVRAVQDVLDAPAWRRVSSALSLLFWARLGSAVVSLLGELAFRIGHEARKRHLLENEFALDSIWDTRECARHVFDVVGLGALFILARRLRGCSGGIALRIALLLSLVVFAWSTGLLHDLYGTGSDALLAVEDFVRLANLVALIMAFRSLRLLATKANEVETRSIASWSAVERASLALFGLVWPALWLSLDIASDRSWTAGQIALLRWVPTTMRVVSEVLILVLVHACRRAVRALVP